MQPEHSRLLDYEKTTVDTSRTELFFLYKKSKKKKKISQLTEHFFHRFQDVHTQSYIMVLASGRWLSVRIELLSSLLTGVVALAAILVSQDAGRCGHITK